MASSDILAPVESGRMSHASWFLQLAAAALLWWMLTAGDPASWVIGVPAVILATVLGSRLARASSRGIALGGVFSYLLFFGIASIKGGWDVAMRALLPGARTSPVFVEYRCSLPAGWPRALFANTVSLLPGTLTVDIEEDRLTLHALSADMQPLDGVRDCERRVASIMRTNPARGEARA